MVWCHQEIFEVSVRAIITKYQYNDYLKKKIKYQLFRTFLIIGTTYTLKKMYYKFLALLMKNKISKEPNNS